MRLGAVGSAPTLPTHQNLISRIFWSGWVGWFLISDKGGGIETMFFTFLVQKLVGKRYVLKCFGLFRTCITVSCFVSEIQEMKNGKSWYVTDFQTWWDFNEETFFLLFCGKNLLVIETFWGLLAFCRAALVSHVLSVKSEKWSFKILAPNGFSNLRRN